MLAFLHTSALVQHPISRVGRTAVAVAKFTGTAGYQESILYFGNVLTPNIANPRLNNAILCV